MSDTDKPTIGKSLDTISQFRGLPNFSGNERVEAIRLLGNIDPGTVASYLEYLSTRHAHKAQPLTLEDLEEAASDAIIEKNGGAEYVEAHKNEVMATPDAKGFAALDAFFRQYDAAHPPQPGAVQNPAGPVVNQPGDASAAPPTPAPAPPEEPKTPFEFDTNKATLSKDQKAEIAKLAEQLKSKAPNMVIVVYGHTDTVGNVSYNYTLANSRANVVRDELIKLGVPPERIRTHAYKNTDEGGLVEKTADGVPNAHNRSAQVTFMDKDHAPDNNTGSVLDQPGIKSTVAHVSLGAAAASARTTAEQRRALRGKMRAAEARKIEAAAERQQAEIAQARRIAADAAAREAAESAKPPLAEPPPDPLVAGPSAIHDRLASTETVTTGSLHPPARVTGERPAGTTLPTDHAPAVPPEALKPPTPVPTPATGTAAVPLNTDRLAGAQPPADPPPAPASKVPPPSSPKPVPAVPPVAVAPPPRPALPPATGVAPSPSNATGASAAATPPRVPPEGVSVQPPRSPTPAVPPVAAAAPPPPPPVTAAASHAAGATAARLPDPPPPLSPGAPVQAKLPFKLTWNGVGAGVGYGFGAFGTGFAAVNTFHDIQKGDYVGATVNGTTTLLNGALSTRPGVRVAEEAGAVVLTKLGVKALAQQVPVVGAAVALVFGGVETFNAAYGAWNKQNTWTKVPLTVAAVGFEAVAGLGGFFTWGAGQGGRQLITEGAKATLGPDSAPDDASLVTLGKQAAFSLGLAAPPPAPPPAPTTASAPDRGQLKINDAGATLDPARTKVTKMPDPSAIWEVIGGGF